MYRIPNDLDLTDIVGSELTQVCLGRYEVQFDFHSGTNIGVQGDITLLAGETLVGRWTESANWTSLSFQTLLNVPVIRYSIPNDRLLRIEFDNGFVLQIHDDSDQYESFQITKKETDEMIVV